MGRPAKTVAIGPRNAKELDADGDAKNGVGAGLRMLKAPPDSQCITKGCKKPLAFAGAELCREHGQKLAMKLQKEKS